MAGQAHQIHRQLGHINRHAACGLRRIHMENNATRTADFANRIDVLNHANFIVDEHDRGQNGVGAQRRFKCRQIQQTIGLHIQISNFKTLALERTHGIEHGLVFGFHRNQVLALGFIKSGGALDRQVIALGGTTGPNDFTRVSVQQRRHMAARVFNGFFRFPAPGMAAAGGVTKVLSQPRHHGIDHTGIAGRSCAVIKVNREMRGHDLLFFL